ncbi:hypothetical protein BJV78DRAFT_535013 [Lactifluus subvellereus]|nr:hypothetical protein BJV78DRAFT_535013 [Lactifluus subvellereus]
MKCWCSLVEGVNYFHTLSATHLVDRNTESQLFMTLRFTLIYMFTTEVTLRLYGQSRSAGLCFSRSTNASGPGISTGRTTDFLEHRSIHHHQPRLDGGYRAITKYNDRQLEGVRSRRSAQNRAPKKASTVVVRTVQCSTIRTSTSPRQPYSSDSKHPSSPPPVRVSDCPSRCPHSPHRQAPAQKNQNPQRPSAPPLPFPVP